MSDDRCLVNSCCCGCTLRTGALVTAILSLIGGVLGTALYIYAAIQTGSGFVWAAAVVYSLVLFVAILLAHGVRKEIPKLLRIWVYIQIVILILMTILTIVLAIQRFDIGTFISYIGTFISYIATIAIQAYFIIVVRSYAVQLESGGGGANPS